MNHRILHVLIGCGVILVSMGCHREIPPTDDEVIVGYAVRGAVTDFIGNPVPGVEVRLFYQYDYNDSGDPPPDAYTVESSSEILQVRVEDRAGRVVRILFSGSRPPGEFRQTWDKRDSVDGRVASGRYAVIYRSDGEDKMVVPVIVSGEKVAVTDVQGEYRISDFHLPIGFYPVPIYSQSGTTFLGNYVISSTVILEFVTPSSQQRKFVTLVRDRVSYVDATF